MSNSKLTRRGLLKTGAGAGLALSAPTLFTGASWAASHTGFTNAPTGSTVTIGFNVPQTGPYAEEGLDELRAQELAVEHLNGEGDGGMLNTFSERTSTEPVFSARRSSLLPATRRRNRTLRAPRPAR